MNVNVVNVISNNLQHPRYTRDCKTDNRPDFLNTFERFLNRVTEILEYFFNKNEYSAM